MRFLKYLEILRQRGLVGEIYRGISEIWEPLPRVRNEIFRVPTTCFVGKIIGRNFCSSVMEPIISHSTGFNLTILKTKKGIVKDLIFNNPTIVFSQKGSWKIYIDGDKINLNSKDTFSIPINKKVSISADNNEDCFLNCVSKA